MRETARGRSGIGAGRFGRPLRWMMALAAVWLGAFHALLLWERIATDQILATGVLVRWGIAFVVLAASIALARSRRVLRRESLLLALGLVVVVLHLGIGLDGAPPALPATIGAAGAGLPLLPLASALAFALALAALAAATSHRPLRPGHVEARGRRSFDPHARPFAPRPPPFSPSV